MRRPARTAVIWARDVHVRTSKAKIAFFILVPDVRNGGRLPSAPDVIFAILSLHPAGAEAQSLWVEAARLKPCPPDGLSTKQISPLLPRSSQSRDADTRPAGHGKAAPPLRAEPIDVQPDRLGTLVRAGRLRRCQGLRLERDCLPLRFVRCRPGRFR